MKPWKAETFKFSTHPEPEAKVSDMVGLHSEAAGERDRVVCGRKVRGSGVESDPKDLADAAPAMPSNAPTTTSGGPPHELDRQWPRA